MPLTLSAVLEHAAHRHASRVAVVEGERHLTYAEVVHRAARLAAALARLGAGPGDRIAVLDRNSSRVLESYFACAWGGFAIVPLNIRLAPRELAQIVAEAEPKVVIVGEPLAGLWEETGAGPPHVLDPREYERRLDRAAPAGATPFPADAPAAIYYTSGTTGEPKGVCLGERAFLAGIDDAMYAMDFRIDDVWLHAAPLFHLADAFAIWALTLAGARHVMLHFEPGAFLHAIERERVTKTSIAPTLIDMVARRAEGGVTDVSSLRRVSFGGAPASAELYQRGRTLVGCDLLQAYGVTEAAGFVCCRLPGDAGAPQHLSVGRPVPGVALRVVRDDGTEAAPGEVGELAIAGPKLLSGYFRQPEATADVLREGWYYTGDVGYRDAENLVYICDRRKDMIISGGENVYSVEVEQTLCAHPAVMEAAVFGSADPTWGETVQAVVVLRPGAQASEAEIIDWCRGRIGRYKVPRSIAFSRDPLPTSGPGKIAKHLLREQHLLRERGRA